MENNSDSLINEETFYYPSQTNFGVASKKLKAPRNIHISFSPLSSNQKISFSNTIMIPCITTEASEDTENNMTQNISKYQNEKSKLSTKKDNTRMKTESSKDEKNNISTEKQITGILIENDKDVINEKFSEIEPLNFDKRESLEINPYFLGGKLHLDLNKYQNDNSEYENKNVKKILDMNTNIKIDEEINNLDKNVKVLRKKSTLKKNNDKSNNIKKVKTFNLAQIPKKIYFAKEDIEKKPRRSKFKYNDIHSTEKHLNQNDNNHLIKNSKVPIENNEENIFRRKRLNTIRINSTLRKFQEKNNIYKDNFFHKKSSSNFGIFSNIDIPEKKEEENISKEKHSRLRYKIKSHKYLNMIGLGIEPKEENKNNEGKKSIKENFKRKESHEKERNNNSYRNKSNRKKSNINTRFKKGKSADKNKDNITNEKKKTKNKGDFEKQLKDKSNLYKTQFNLFSPDKFTNTQFCGCDYLEYTLECMDLILKSNPSQKQQKNKINFNFPKQKGNKPKKKIALFDLDETLVHCTGEINLSNETYQHCIEVILPCNKTTKVGINIRPYWKKTLNLIKKNYHIVVFTASHQAYADAVLNFMDPNNKYFKYRLYRNNCSLVDIDGIKFYVKDLDIFEGIYDLKDIIIVDNSVLSFIYHLENGIPIVPYYNEDKDGSLYVVGLYLKHIFEEDDLREANKKYINLESFLNEAKNRKDFSESTISEESINTDKNQDIDNSNKKVVASKENFNVNINKKNSINDKKTILDNNINRINKKRCSFSIANAQNNLISQSKLINIFYEINNRDLSDKKIEELCKEKTDKSVSIIEDEEIKENKNYKKNIDSFFGKRLLTSDDKTKYHKRNSKSNKNLYNALNMKIIHSNFYNNFSKGEFAFKE